jgi:hypothetical protein
MSPFQRTAGLYKDVLTSLRRDMAVGKPLTSLPTTGKGCDAIGMSGLASISWTADKILLEEIWYLRRDTYRPVEPARIK